MLLFSGRKLFLFVDCHPSFRSISLNAMVRSMFPLESKIRISPARKHGCEAGSLHVIQALNNEFYVANLRIVDSILLCKLAATYRTPGWKNGVTTR